MTILHLSKKLTHTLLMPLLFLSTLEAKSPKYYDSKLTDEELHSVMGIITNFILMEEPKGFRFVGLSSSVTVGENQTSVLTLVVADATGSVSYSISGGDSSSFTIDSSTGVITFNTAPDFETRDTYTLTVTAIDSAGHTTTQDVTIHISNLPEPTLKTGQTKSYNEAGTEVLDNSIKDDGFYQTGVTPSYTRDDATNIVTDHITEHRSRWCV